MRKEIFSFPRFAQLARYEVLTRRKSLGYFVLGSYAGLLAAYLGVNAASNNSFSPVAHIWQQSLPFSSISAYTGQAF